MIVIVVFAANECYKLTVYSCVEFVFIIILFIISVLGELCKDSVLLILFISDNSIYTF